MKKLSILLIGIVIVAITCLSEMALSVVEKDKWSNYTHSWETKWTTPFKQRQIESAVANNKITTRNAQEVTNQN